MAKKKSANAMQVPMSTGSGEVGSRVEAVKNGFIVHLTRDNVGKEHRYENERLIATTRPKAMRIANEHLRGAEAKMKRSKGRKKARSSGR